MTAKMLPSTSMDDDDGDGEAVAAQVEAERERGEARAWQLAVAEGTGYINHAEGQGGYEIAPAETIIAAYANAVEERDELHAEVARLKRIEAAAEAWLHEYCAQSGYAAEVVVSVLRHALDCIDPDSEVKT